MSVPQELVERLATWHNMALANIAFGWILIGFAGIAGASVTFFADDLSKLGLKVLGFIAAGCTVLTATLSPLSTGASFREAWTILDDAIRQHKLNPATFPVAEVNKAALQGQLIINKQVARAAQLNQASASSPAASSPAN